MRRIIVLVILSCFISTVAYGIDLTVSDIRKLREYHSSLVSDVKELSNRKVQIQDRLGRKDLTNYLKELYEVELDLIEKEVSKKNSEISKIDTVLKSVSTNSNKPSTVMDIIKKYTKNSQKLQGAKMRFISPLKTYRFSSSYGYRLHPVFKDRRFHNGVDLAAKKGTAIRAIESGLVVKAGSQGGYGNTVILMHRRGYMSLYGHMSRIDVKKGDVVKRGDIIGYVGSTGVSTGNHLHLEIFKDGYRINPEKLIDFKK